MVLTATVDSSVRVFDTFSGEFQLALGGHAGLSFIAFSPDASTLVTTSGPGRVKLWDVTSWTCSQTITVPHREPLTSVVFSHDGNTMLALGCNNIATVLQAEAGIW